MDVNRCHSHDGTILHFGVYKSRRGDDEKFVEREEHGQNSPPSIPSALIASCSSGASYEVPRARSMSTHLVELNQGVTDQFAIDFGPVTLRPTPSCGQPPVQCYFLIRV